MNTEDEMNKEETKGIDRMHVINRSGKMERVKYDLITERNQKIADELKLDIDVEKLSQHIISGLYPGIKTTQIDEMSADHAAAQADTNPDYDRFATYILISDIHKRAPKTFRESIELMKDNINHKTKKPKSLVSDDSYSFIVKHISRIESEITTERDHLFNYFGLKTLMKSNLAMSSDKTVLYQTPQYLFMGVACGIGPNKRRKNDNIDHVINTYHFLSLHYYIHGSPTLFNSLSPVKQLASCFLAVMPNTIDGIFEMYKNIANISKRGGGVGVDLSAISARGCILDSNDGAASGIIPIMRCLDNISDQVSQGKRKGAFAAYLQPWHPEIADFIVARLPDTNHLKKVEYLFLAIWMNELFMERVANNGIWSLFEPSEHKDLLDLYGNAFNKRYIELEDQKRYVKQVKARELYALIVGSRQKQGIPYMLNKDSINEKSNHKNIGSIRLSNLCCEIVEFSGDGEISVCNLSSIALPKFVKKKESLADSCVCKVLCVHKIFRGKTPKNILPEVKGLNGNIVSIIDRYSCLYCGEQHRYSEVSENGYVFDFTELGKVVEIAAQNCDQNIDINFYPTPETKKANDSQRPIGIGYQGLADVFHKMRYSWESKEAARLNIQISAVMYYHALKKSMELSREYSAEGKGSGAYPKFEGSPTSQGILQFDMWKVKPDTSVITQEMWDQLKADIMKYGLRNSMSIALMPTATTSNILGNNECIEPYTFNIYSRKTLAGIFYIFCKGLYEYLKENGLWNQSIINRIIKDRGSVQNISEIPKKYKDIFKTVWEINPKVIIDLAADRSPYICQTQSFNAHLAKPTVEMISGLDYYAYKKGLKTISYYVRSKGAVEALNFNELEDTIGEKVDKAGKMGRLEGSEKVDKITVKDTESGDVGEVCYRGKPGCDSCGA